MFEESLGSLLKKAKETNSELSILFIDIDNFKTINDSYGHLIGDKVLKTIATLLTNECRSIDTIYRRGGDEFTIILDNCELTKAHTVAERIRISIQQFKHKLDSGESVSVSVSIGISSYPATTIDDNLLIGHADLALYEA